MRLEPALGHGRARFAGAIHDTSDGTGDPNLFATASPRCVAGSGVTFHLGTSVDGFDTDGSSITRIHTSNGTSARTPSSLRRAPQAPC